MIKQGVFPGAPESVPTARHFVSKVIADIPQEIADQVALMVSELATNAVRHGGTAFEVRVERTSEELCVEVADSGQGLPTVRQALPRDSSGRGLRIIESLADNWGVRPANDGPGKTVWFTLSLSSAERGADRASCR